MNWKIGTIVGLAVACAIGAGYFWFRKTGPATPVAVTFRFSVTPPDQADFVLGQASSALFKYELGKAAGMKPALAQRLATKPVPGSPLLEAQVRVPTQADGERLAAAFLDLLQAQCGERVQLAEARRTVR